MTRRVKREEWLQDIEARQRNVVFPDTVNNEARFWRNIIEGKRKLSVVQRVGVGLMVLVVGVIAFVITFDWGNPLHPGFSRWNLLGGVARWVFGLGVLALFLATTETLIPSQFAPRAGNPHPVSPKSGETRMGHRRK